VFNVIFQYEIIYKGNGILKLKNINNKIIQAIDIEKVRHNFIFAWCATAHSMQGQPVDTEITIFDYNHFLVKKIPRMAIYLHHKSQRFK